MNMVRKFRFCWIGLCLGIASYAMATKPLYIEISGGQTTGLPIAVVPFEVSGPIKGKDSVTDISKIIRQNLHNSGQFKPYPILKMEQFPKISQEVDFTYWQSLGIENILLGSIVETGRNAYRVTFELYDVFKANEREGSQKPLAPILAMQFYDISTENFRALAHHISDLAFEKILGVKGVFSTRIAYVSEAPAKRGRRLYTLHVSDSDGYNQKIIQQSHFPLMSPSWSPDGEKIAYVSFMGNHSSIQVVELKTAKVERLTHFKGINGAPAWSPNGKELALVLSKDGSPHLYLLNLETHNLKQLTFGSAIDTEPAWFPNGKQLVFTSNRGGKPQIYKIDLDSLKVSRLTFEGSYNAKPVVTPDGKRLVMMHKTESGYFNIAVQAFENGKLRLLTRAMSDESPSLAPNGMMVLYGSKEAGEGVLKVVSLDGRFRMRLPAGVMNIREPAWSPLSF